MPNDERPYEYDLIVIGGGPAGEKGAAQAAYFGKRVALVEDDDVGGVAVNTGTLPSKTLRETALYLSGLGQRGLYGIDYTFNREVTVEDLIRREQSVVRTHQQLAGENIARHGIELFIGVAAMRDAHTVEVTREHGRKVTLRGEYVLIATGSSPYRPAEVPFDGRVVYDSDSILQLKRLPSTMIVIGAGVVGSEYATFFGALGAKVTLLDSGERLLPFLDYEISDVLARRMAALGVTLRCGSRVREMRPQEGGVTVLLEDGDELSGDTVLFCGGRVGNTAELGLEAVGVETRDRGRVVVDEHFRTTAPTVYAAGDVIGKPALASTSMEQARVAVCHAFDFAYKQQMSALVPYGLYTIPEVSMVGATEEELQEDGRAYLVGRASYKQNPRAQILGDTSGLVKLLFEPKEGRVLGVHVVGEQASELVHIGQACMYFGGTLDFFVQNVFNFPTLSDLYKYAAYDGLGQIARLRGEK